MSKQLRRLVILLVLSLVISVTILAVEAKTDFGCFHSLRSSSSQIAKRVNINLPQSASNLQWRCLSGIIEGDDIYLKFTIATTDFKSFIAINSNYYSWDFIDPSFFFRERDEYSTEEHRLADYRTFQGNSTCGWINLLVDMDDPYIYTVYADYHDWEHCYGLL